MQVGGHVQGGGHGGGRHGRGGQQHGGDEHLFGGGQHEGGHIGRCELLRHGGQRSSTLSGQRFGGTQRADGQQGVEHFTAGVGQLLKLESQPSGRGFDGRE